MNITTKQQIERILEGRKASLNIGRIHKVLSVDKPSDMDLRALNDAELGYVSVVFGMEETFGTSDRCVKCCKQKVNQS